MRNTFLSGGAHKPENILCKSSGNSLRCYPHLDLGYEFGVQGKILALEKSRKKLVLMEAFHFTVCVSMWTAEQQNSAFGQMGSQHTRPECTWSLSHMQIFIYVCRAPGRFCIHLLHFHTEVPYLAFYFYFFFPPLVKSR